MGQMVATDSRREASGMSQVVDAFGRTVDYLRISVTDRCNERCLYCMPEGYKGWAQKKDHLTADEIVRSVEAATALGFRKFRITGGEPLLRHDIVEIVERIGRLPGTRSLGVSTNGTRLAGLADQLRRAGVNSLNISLDALDAAVYSRITGGRLADVLGGIDAAVAADFETIKLNCVLLRGINEDEFLPIVRFAAERNLPIRFIELMPLSRGQALHDPHFFPIGELQRQLTAGGVLGPEFDAGLGHGPARYHLYTAHGLPTAVRIGFIGAMTTEHFCAGCNKIRLTADGKLRPCLGRHGEIDLADSLRRGENPIRLFLEAIRNKPENHEFLEAYSPGRPMTAIGG